MGPAASELERRRAGVCLHLSSLPGPRGIGELGAAAFRFVDWLRARNLSVWQFLPTGPTGYGNSPYQPLSVFAGNPWLIDLECLADWELLSRPESDCRLPEAESEIDFDRIAAVRQPLLERAADRLLASRDSGLREEFDAFAAREGTAWLDAYAAFAVFKAANGEQAWPFWREPERRAAAGAIDLCRAEHRSAWDRIRVIQFLFARQWRALREYAAARGVLLFGDVPIYMALDCAEAWADPGLLALDESFRPLELAGVPPDYFSADGQLWGNPIYRWDAQEADGFHWWITRLEHALAAADLVRLDHFRAFDAYWSIAAGAVTAREGRWCPGPGSRFFDALGAALGRMPFVAEDLGLITESVTALRRAYALPGMQVLQFLVDQPGFDAGAIGEDTVCYTGTHDNDTTVGWYAGSSGRLGSAALDAFRALVARNVEDAGEGIHKAMIQLCFRTRSRLAITPLQDLLGLDSRARLNTPGQAAGNWRWRVTEALLEADDPDWIGALAATTGRA